MLAPLLPPNPSAPFLARGHRGSSPGCLCSRSLDGCSPTSLAVQPQIAQLRRPRREVHPQKPFAGKLQAHYSNYAQPPPANEAERCVGSRVGCWQPSKECQAGCGHGALGREAKEGSSKAPDTRTGRWGCDQAALTMPFAGVGLFCGYACRRSKLGQCSGSYSSQTLQQGMQESALPGLSAEIDYSCAWKL